jgi:serine/threonine-protein kinase HipA
MFKPVNAIEVRIWGRKVGALALDPKLGFYAFEYDPKFARSRIELAPLKMPLSNAAEPFVFTDLAERSFKRLPAMLSDALPDDFGNNLIDAWMARHGIAKERVTALDRLAYMGKRGMGALEFRPARGSHSVSTTAIKLSKLIDSARAAVHGEIESDELAQSALNQIIQVGTSAGGARAKAAIAWNPKTNEIRAGQFDVNRGYEHWLLKFDGIGLDRGLGSTQDYGRIEYAYFLMARDAGINISDCRLLEENGRAHFMTRRFDRNGNIKHHIQTLCAMAHLDYQQQATHDYSQLFLTIEQLGLNFSAKEEAFRRMVFNVIAANCDDHTKNISFILREGSAWELAHSQGGVGPSASDGGQWQVQRHHKG